LQIPFGQFFGLRGVEFQSVEHKIKNADQYLTITIQKGVKNWSSECSQWVYQCLL